MNAFDFTLTKHSRHRISPSPFPKQSDCCLKICIFINEAVKARLGRTTYDCTRADMMLITTIITTAPLQSFWLMGHSMYESHHMQLDMSLIEILHAVAHCKACRDQYRYMCGMDFACSTEVRHGHARRLQQSAPSGGKG